MTAPTEPTLAQQIDVCAGLSLMVDELDHDTCDALRAAAATLRDIRERKALVSHKCGYPVYGGNWGCGNLIRGDGRCYRHRNKP